MWARPYFRHPRQQLAPALCEEFGVDSRGCVAAPSAEAASTTLLGELAFAKGGLELLLLVRADDSSTFRICSDSSAPMVGDQAWLSRGRLVEAEHTEHTVIVHCLWQAPSEPLPSRQQVTHRPALPRKLDYSGGQVFTCLRTTSLVELYELVRQHMGFTTTLALERLALVHENNTLVLPAPPPCERRRLRIVVRARHATDTGVLTPDLRPALNDGILPRAPTKQ